MALLASSIYPEATNSADGGQHLVIHTDRAEGPAQTQQRIEVEKFN
jgi:hypothetical protein